MKKLLLASAFFLVTFLIFPSEVRASCYFPNTTGGVHCAKGLFGCTDSNNNYWCCTAKNECAESSFTPPPTPTPTPPQGTDEFNCVWSKGSGTCSFSSGNCENVEGVDCEQFTKKKTCENNPHTCGAPTPAPTFTPGSADILCNGDNGINTAIGCIPFGDTNAFIVFILRWAMGVGGGIAFFLIIIATFQIMSSSGNPERLKAGQELMTSAIAGLIMLIFSVFILKVIGVDILKLPGFGQ